MISIFNLLAPLVVYSAVGPNRHQFFASGEKVSGSPDTQHVQKWATDWSFTGIATFGHSQFENCLVNPGSVYDIAVIGLPFDTLATYRPGTRLGPRAIRTASARHTQGRAYNTYAGVNPYNSWAKIIDCGDIPVTPINNKVALQQMTEGLISLGSRQSAHSVSSADSAIQAPKPRLIGLGGDHTVSLPALRALREVYGHPIALLHFDAHLDTLSANAYPTDWPSEDDLINHGTVFRKAFEEGLLDPKRALHVGINTRLTGDSLLDLEDDAKLGFKTIMGDEIETLGTAGIVSRIEKIFGSYRVPVYLSVDIDVLDPAFAPATGAPEPGGWSTRELLSILRGLKTVNFIGADVVEVSPPYDTAGSDTAFAAANIVYEIISNMVATSISQAEHAHKAKEL